MMVLAKGKIWSLFLLIILLAGVSYACGNPEVPSTSDTPSVPAEKVEVVYFHRTQRCYSCFYAEAGIRYTLETYFADELANGKVIFEVIDVDDIKNIDVVKKYGAFTSSLFINAISDGTDHIKEVTDIWLVLGNEKEFVEVVKDNIKKSLQGAK